MQDTPTTVPAIMTISTSVEHQGDNIIISAGTEEHLRAYLHSIGITEVGEVRKTGIVIGPLIGIPSAASLISDGTKAAIEFAAKLGTRVMGYEITIEEAREAKKLGLVVVFGYSDDCVEFRGAIHEEDCVGTIKLTDRGKILTIDEENALESLKESGLARDVVLRTITATYDNHHHYDTDTPHATFDVMEDEELFCRAIVFSISDLKL